MKKSLRITCYMAQEHRLYSDTQVSAADLEMRCNRSIIKRFWHGALIPVLIRTPRPEHQ
jgi:hypothetical protein